METKTIKPTVENWHMIRILMQADTFWLGSCEKFSFVFFLIIIRIPTAPKKGISKHPSFRKNEHVSGCFKKSPYSTLKTSKHNIGKVTDLQLCIASLGFPAIKLLLAG
jgi:hypothetical protein